jgi:hypothetical protein
MSTNRTSHPITEQAVVAKPTEIAKPAEVAESTQIAKARKRTKKEKLRSAKFSHKVLSKEHNKLVKAIQAWREADVIDVVSFTVANHNSSFWNKYNHLRQYEQKRTIANQEENIIVRQEVAEFLPIGVDLKISIRNGLTSETLIKHLRKICEAISENQELAKFSKIKDGYITDEMNWAVCGKRLWIWPL